jgi:hypothetical protein
MNENWTLQIVGDVVKDAAMALAKRDGRDPLARTNDGREVWRAYIYEVERVLLILDAYERGKTLAGCCESPQECKCRAGAD